MKTILSTAAALLVLSSGVALADGDIAQGEKDFKKCKACHSIVSPEGDVIVKGGKTGPNLWGVIGRVAASDPEFGKYGDSISALGATGFTWSPELITEYAKDPKAFLQAQLDDKAAKSMMTFKLKDAFDVAAFLAQYGAVEAGDDMGSDEDADADTEGDSE